MTLDNACRLEVTGPTEDRRASWGSCYPLIRLNTPGQPSELPGEEWSIPRDHVIKQGQNPWVRGTSGGSDTLIFGERSGGVRDLLKWWCDTLDSAKLPWVQVLGSAWDPAFFGWSEHAKQSQNAEQMEKANLAIEQFGCGATVTDRAKALARWAHNLPQPCTLILRHLSALATPGDQQAAEALAVLRESDYAPNLRLVVADGFDTIYQATRTGSGYLRFCYVYRLAPLDAAAISELAKPLNFSDDALGCVIQYTGGQRLLVRHLLRRLQSPRQPDGETKYVETKDVEKAGQSMLAALPIEVGAWKLDLRRLLCEHPHLRRRMETYAAGGTLGRARFPPPSEERPLFIAGWLRHYQSDRWGIASLIHRDLARSVLDQASGVNHG